jgi:hypothetical protein
LLKRLQGLNKKLESLLLKRLEFDSNRIENVFDRGSAFWTYDSRQNWCEKKIDLYCGWQRCMQEKELLVQDLKNISNHCRLDSEFIGVYMQSETRLTVRTMLEAKFHELRQVESAVQLFLQSQ